MLPHTVVAYNGNSLLECVTRFNANNIRNTVVKRDKKNGGIGIHRFASIEDVYNQAELGNLSYPFVVQPLIEAFKDIRILILGDYIEAYERQNLNNFRQNIHCGGISTPTEINEILLRFCEKVMVRGAFPYAHIDVMETQTGEYFLSEINLRGGLKGAKIPPTQYQSKIDSIHKQIIATLHRRNEL